ncbi:MAG TPA: DJ-1/PfpI family protein [Steroidobacteraceae bacterium]|nr:DJ-1/PfpI family protein [Steroidobacteraceae bacterium]
MNPKDVKVAILMFDGVQIIDFAAPYEVFTQAGLTVYTVSKEGKQVTASQGLKTQVDYSFESAPAANIVVVPGGHIHDAEKDAATLDWIRKQAGPADHVLSVCTGSFILGSTGLLDGKSATTFHQSFDGMAKQFPKVHVVSDQRWVDSGELVTSAGLASGIDASLHVVAEVRGMKVARSVAMNLEYDWKPEQGFVRGKMADRYMRLPAAFSLPPGTKVQPVTSIGDTKSWEKEFAFESALTPEEMFAQFREQARKDPALTVDEKVGPRQLAWEYPDDSGGRWRMTTDASDGPAPGRFQVLVRLAPAAKR